MESKDRNGSLDLEPNYLVFCDAGEPSSGGLCDEPLLELKFNNREEIPTHSLEVLLENLEVEYIVLPNIIETGEDVSATLTVALEEMKANAQSDSLSKVATNSLSYDKRDIILYSLGVGASLNNPEDLKYLYEGHEAFSALPTFLIIPAITTLLGANIIGDVFPGKDIDLTKMLHGEQYLEVIRPLETSGELVSKARVVDVLDKGSGAAILVDGK
uniref:Peroxisomal multifunctional enzyme type 2-like N-terminal domain-containing protein n=1 Tax=Timema tahoe TaxID=61484 RepID=A0A7R9FGH1_9NEOP|nr:unnamed protein product [Timema tahoe]